MKGLAYFWTYSFIRVLVYTVLSGVVAVLLFLGVSAGVVARRTRKRGVRTAFTIEALNAMSHRRGGKV